MIANRALYAWSIVLLLGIVTLGTQWTLSPTPISYAAQAYANANILPQQRQDACSAPPDLTALKPIVRIAPSDDSSANGAPTIFVYSPTPTSQPVVATLQDIRDGLAALSPPRSELLTETVMPNGEHVWTLGMHMQISRTVTLRISGGPGAVGARVDWLRLRSDPSPGYPKLSDPNNPDSSKIYDFTSFAALRTRNGSLFIENTKITSWDTTIQAVDTNYEDGRPFLLAREDARMDICNSEIAYLGFGAGQAYGLSWRDVNSSSDPPEAPKRRRVRGDMIGSESHHNYYGYYTFQAQDMIVRGNKFYSNIQYGFDPHDYTTDVLVEHNEAFDNGNHGFIISRGCERFVFYRNKSYENRVKPGSKNPSAHGFMLDPGSPSSGQQSPSVNNLYIENESYNNDGYGIRILDSDDNTFIENKFIGNRTGISLEEGSSNNRFQGNIISGNIGQKIDEGGVKSLKGGYGVTIYGGSDANIFEAENLISDNATVGISIKTANNLIVNNIITGNGQPDQLYSDKSFEGILINLEASSDPAEPSANLTIGGRDPEAELRSDETLPADDYIFPPSRPIAKALAVISQPANNRIEANTISNNRTNGITVKAASGTQIIENVVEANLADGISLSADANNSLVEQNSVKLNGIYGIEVAGSLGTLRNRLTRNGVTDNGSDGISVRDGANAGIQRPSIQFDIPSLTLTGTGAQPNATIEVFSDSANEGAFYETTLSADGSGTFSYTFSAPPTGSFITVTQTDGDGNTSAFASAKSTGVVMLSTPSHTATLTRTPSLTPSQTLTPSKSLTASQTLTPSRTFTASQTVPPNSSATASHTPTRTQTKPTLPSGRHSLYLPLVRN